jgi:IrrE N-terminal-like domain/Chagasin family peptidase inhibitor I42
MNQGLSSEALAVLAAGRLLSEHQVDQSRQTPVFELLRSSGLEVMFQPLHTTFGVYLPRSQDSAAGVLLNSNLPRAVQRFTAAHELGHHILQHPATTDEEQNIQSPNTAIERQAEVFSERLMMPELLIQGAMERIGCPDGPTEQQHVYQLSLEVGTSYSATLLRLLRLNLVNPRTAEEWFRKSPRDAKASLVDDSLVDDFRRDMILVHPNDARNELYARQGDIVVVELDETPSTGFIWSVEMQGVGREIQNSAVIRPELYGAPVKRRRVFQIEEPGSGVISLRLQRPWQPDEPTASREVLIHGEVIPLGPLRVPV